MKKVNSHEKKPTCLAALDFQIISETLGKEKAIEVFRLIDGLRKEREFDEQFGIPVEKPEPPCID